MPLLAALAAMLAVLFGATAAVAQPLVSVDWLKTNLAKPDLVVLDLRGNPGGLLDEAVEVASAFLDGGPVVSYEQRDAPDRHLPAQPQTLAQGLSG